MSSRLTFCVVFLVTVVNCVFKSDESFGQNSGFLSRGNNERNHGPDEQTGIQRNVSEFGNQRGSNEPQSFSDLQEMSGFNENLDSSTSRYKEKNSFGYPESQNFNNMREAHSSTELIHNSNNKDNTHSSGGFNSINHEHSSSRPVGESTHFTNHTGFNQPSSFSPSSLGGDSFDRPTGESTYTQNNREGDNHSSNFRPSGSDESSFVRPSGFRPISEGGQSSRPNGQSSHNQPLNQNSFDKETHSLGSDHQEPAHSFTDSLSGLTSPANNEQIGSSNHSQTENDNEDKEEEKDVCFNRLGCFKMGKPWKSVLRPIKAPHSPEKIQTTIHFYSRENLEKQKNITVYPEIIMREAQFDPRKISVVIVHGFSSSGNATWMKDMKNVYLKKVDANVMIVDWGKGAQLLNYLQVAGNTRVVGKQLGLFVKYLIENFGADPGKFHLIGHSLGAQICSYLAKEVPGIARLTALDPAQPGFEGFNKEVRLDKSDAEFVDVIHTDARPFIPTLGFGMIAPHGHVDFYMNGGYDQPGCVPPPKEELPSIRSFLDFAKYPVEVISKIVSCPHGRAYQYLIESFNETDQCIFWGHKADVKNVFKSVTNTVTQGLVKKFTALSTTCSKEDCIPVGFATKKSPLRGIFVVTTNNRMPYCISEPGIPPETPPQERKQESFIQKIGRKTGISG